MNCTVHFFLTCSIFVQLPFVLPFKYALDRRAHEHALIRFLGLNYRETLTNCD